MKKYIENDYGMKMYTKKAWNGRSKFGFKDRKRFTSDAEKSRNNVKNNITNALKYIKAEFPLLHDHLIPRIKKGLACQYTMKFPNLNRWRIHWCGQSDRIFKHLGSYFRYPYLNQLNGECKSPAPGTQEFVEMHLETNKIEGAKTVTFDKGISTDQANNPWQPLIDENGVRIKKWYEKSKYSLREAHELERKEYYYKMTEEERRDFKNNLDSHPPATIKEDSRPFTPFTDAEIWEVLQHYTEVYQNVYRRRLVCFYDPEKKNWNEKIEEIIQIHGAEDDRFEVVCLPQSVGKKGVVCRALPSDCALRSADKKRINYFRASWREYARILSPDT